MAPAAAADKGPEDFVMSYSAHHMTGVNSNAFEKSLNRQARTYCRKMLAGVNAAGVRTGCRRALVKAVLEQVSKNKTRHAEFHQ